GFRQSSAHNEPGSWPPFYSNPFDGTPDIPEIQAHELNLNTLSGGILHHGSLIVRNLISTEDASNLAADIDSTVGAMQRSQEGAPREETAPWYSPSSHLKTPGLNNARHFINQAGGALAADSPRTMFNLFEHYYRLGLKELLSSYLGERPCLSASKCVLRRLKPQAEEQDWHQDGAFMGDEARSIDLWIALSHCGGNTDTPGI